MAEQIPSPPPPKKTKHTAPPNTPPPPAPPRPRGQGPCQGPPGQQKDSNDQTSPTEKWTANAENGTANACSKAAKRSHLQEERAGGGRGRAGESGAAGRGGAGRGRGRGGGRGAGRGAALRARAGGAPAAGRRAGGGQGRAGRRPRGGGGGSGGAGPRSQRAARRLSAALRNLPHPACLPPPQRPGAMASGPEGHGKGKDKGKGKGKGANPGKGSQSSQSERPAQRRRRGLPPHSPYLCSFCRWPLREDGRYFQQWRLVTSLTDSNVFVTFKVDEEEDTQSPRAEPADWAEVQISRRAQILYESEGFWWVGAASSAMQTT